MCTPLWTVVEISVGCRQKPTGFHKKANRQLSKMEKKPTGFYIKLWNICWWTAQYLCLQLHNHNWTLWCNLKTCPFHINVFQKDKIMLKYPSNRTAFTTGSSNQGSFILLEHPCSNLKRLALEVIKLHMERVIDKFGLHTRHLNEFISREKNSKNRATA